MKIAGHVVIIPEAPKGGRPGGWRVFGVNRGQHPWGLTHNIFPDKELARTSKAHDDNGRWGHGIRVPPGQAVGLNFHQGDLYNGGKIEAGCYLRLGVRDHAERIVKLPSLRRPEPMIFDLADFVWYNGSPSGVVRDTSAGMDNYQAQAINKTQSMSIQELMAQVEACRKLEDSGVDIQGNVTVTAVQDAHGRLSHWTVEVRNTGPQAFIGTAAFVGAVDKNEGLGLESMPVPRKGSRALQRIEALGNYGVPARPNERLRVGARGFGWAEIPLPAAGSKVVSLDDFIVDTTQMDAAFFDEKQVAGKQAEKFKKVQFFEGDRCINAEIKPITHRGEEAIARSRFNPPRVVVTAVPATEDRPAGWEVEVTSKMPREDDRGPVGFVATLKLGATGVSGRDLPPKKLEAPGEKKGWFIPEGLRLNGHVAAAGHELNVGTRGLGWFAGLRLPKPGASLDTDGDAEIWGFREDQYARNNLSPEFLAQCRQ